MTTSREAKGSVLPIEKPVKREKAARGLSRTKGLRPVSKKLQRARRLERPAIYTFACDVEQQVATCWFAQFSDTPCSGRIEKVHLLAKQTVRREVWDPVAKGRVEAPDHLPATLRELLWDRRIWRFGCHGHHHDLDCSKRLVLERSDIPASVEEFAREYGLTAKLDYVYGERREVAA